MSRAIHTRAGLNAIATHVFQITSPNATAEIAQDSFAAFDGYKEFERLLHNLVCAFEACEFLSLPKQTLINFDPRLGHKERLYHGI